MGTTDTIDIVELRNLTRDILQVGFNETNYEEILNYIRLIVECQDKSIYFNDDCVFFLSVINDINIESPIFECLKNIAQNTYKYLHFLNPTKQPPNIYTKYSIDESGNKLIVNEFIDNTGVTKEVSRVLLQDPQKTNLHQVFKDLLMDDVKDLQENEL